MKKVALLLLLLSAHYAFAEPVLSRERIDGWLSALSSNNDIDDGKMDWGILPGPFVTPELGVGLGIAAVGLYRPDPEDKQSQDSSMTLSGFASSTGAFGFNFENFNFLKNDQWRFFVEAKASNMPTYYWGIGDRNGRQSSNKEEYTAHEFTFKPTVYRRITQSTYLGLGMDVSTIKANDIEEGADSLFELQQEGTSVLSSGLGMHFLYDSRDFVPNPSYGHTVQLGMTFYAPEFGSDQRFQIFTGQYATYYAFNEMSTIAFDIHTQISGGDVPWNKLALLGDSKRMRGYYEGRYRDRNVLSTQIEYRQKFDWRHGAVAWVGSGTMSDQERDLGKGRWLQSVGIGYRFEFKPKMNIRLDLGFGQNSTGFYFQVGEAF